MSQNNNELYHYGVLGMRWGRRRTPQQLGSKVDKLKSRNTELEKRRKEDLDIAKRYDIQSTKTQTRNSKYEGKLAKATAEKAKYDLKLQKELAKDSTSLFFKTDPNKVAEYTAKSAKYNNQMLKAQKKINYNKWKVKSDEFKTYAMEKELQIKKNEKLMSIYNNTIRDLNNGKIKDGKSFLMKYSKPD